MSRQRLRFGPFSVDLQLNLDRLTQPDSKPTAADSGKCLDEILYDVLVKLQVYIKVQDGGVFFKLSNSFKKKHVNTKLHKQYSLKKTFGVEAAAKKP